MLTNPQTALLAAVISSSTHPNRSYMDVRLVANDYLEWLEAYGS